MTSKTPRDNDVVSLNDIERAIAHGDPRERPLAAARERAYRQLRDDWLQSVNRNRRRKTTLLLSIAASVGIAAILLVTVSNRPTTPSLPLQARVMQVAGDDVTVDGAPLAVATDGSVKTTLHIGDTLRTGDGSRLAMAWMQQDSLRVDTNSELTIADGGTIRLSRGRIYFAAPVAANNSENASDIVVETDVGTVRHVGTQFIASIGADGLQIAVREGAVVFAGGPHNFTVHSGTAVRVDRQEKVSRRRISAVDDEWAWTESVAPVFDPNGRSTLELVSWIARETGLQVRFASVGARDRAASDSIVGLPPSTPRQILALLQTATDLDLQVNDTEILIRQRP